MRRVQYNPNNQNLLDTNYHYVSRSRTNKHRRAFKNFNFTRKNIPSRSMITIYPETPNQIKTIFIPTTVTSINANDYNGVGITDVIFTPVSHVTSINSNAFANFTSLKSITIPPSVTTIADNAFFNCINLEKVYIQSTKVTIGTKAFWGCTLLSEAFIVLTPKTS